MGVPQLERYEVIEELGQGGMSVVYRARDRQLNRSVALKVLHDFLARQEDARRRFHREAVAVAKLHHPGIVEIFDYSGPDADQSYIVCELIDGQTLRSMVENEGPIPHPELAALVTAELTRALRHAHEQGIIHRDLKPENIMVTLDGRLKLMDFGIAQIMGGATRLTATGTLLGSPAHMAPEMIDGQPSDHRSDIFSVGTILYWLATATLPFEAPNPSALFRQILEGEYEPAQAIQPRLGNGLSRIIDRALALAPEARYQDISELQDQLNAELGAVGLLPVEASARAYLSRPRTFADEFRPKLVERLADAGKRAFTDGNVGRAMDRFNRVLALEPDHLEVRTLVRRVGRRRAFAARLRQAAVAVLTAFGLSAVGIGVYGLWPEKQPEAARAPTTIGTSIGQSPQPAEPAEPEKATTPAAPERSIRAVETDMAAAPVLPSNAIKSAAASNQQTSNQQATAPRSAPGQTPLRAENKRRAVVRKSKATPTEAVSEPTPASPELTNAGDEPSPQPDAGPPEPPAIVRHPLLLRMSPGWANVTVDGHREAEGRYRVRLSLTPGEHSIVIENKFGQQPPRRVFVHPDGKMTELRPDGTRRPIRGELLIYTPGPRRPTVPRELLRDE